MDIDFIGLAPEAILVLLALYLLIFKEARACNFILFAGLSASLIVSAILWFRTGTAPINLVSVDHFALFFNILFILAAFIVVLISLGYGGVQGMDLKTYLPMVLFATTGMILLPKATNLLTLFLSLEILSISLYVLTGFKKGDKYSVEAGFKYLVLGMFAAAFLLYGISLLYGAFGTTEFSRIYGTVGARMDYLVFLGLVFITLALGFKMAFVPFHMWSPDVYFGAPAPVAAFISTGSKVAIFVVFLKVSMAFSPVKDDLLPVLWVISLLTMTVGNITALLQSDIKRMLAFSSIAHMGYALIALLSFDELGSSALVFNLLAYMLMNLGAFGVVAALSGKEGDFSVIDNYRGLWAQHPLLAGIMAINLFSLAGIPPTAGFIGKFYIFSAAINSGYIGIVVIGIINSIIAIYYYLRVVALMFSRKEGFQGRGGSAYEGLALGLVTFGTVVLGIYPGPAIAVIQDAVRKSFYF